MKKLFYLLISAILSVLVANETKANPVSEMVVGMDQVISRVNRPSAMNFSVLLFKVKHPALVALPVLQLQDLVDHDSNWSGVRYMVNLAATIDPGGITDGRNLFVYTCKGGWIDFGHVMGSALAYTSLRAILVGDNKLLLGNVKRYLQALESKILDEVLNLEPKRMLSGWNDPALDSIFTNLAKSRVEEFKRLKIRPRPGDLPSASKIREQFKQIYEQHYAQRTDGFNEMFADVFAGYFAMRTGYKVEHIQNQSRIEAKVKSSTDLNGWSKSAWTLEDLASDYRGIELAGGLPNGPRSHVLAWLGRQIGMRSDLKSQIIERLKAMKHNLGAVDPKAENSWCTQAKDKKGNFTKSVGDMLRADADYYGVESGKVNPELSLKSSQDTASAFSVTIDSKKTRQHDCVCDSYGNPIDTRFGSYASFEAKVNPKDLDGKLH